MVQVEQLRRNNHGDREVATQLVVGPFTTGARTIDVLVDAATIHDGWVHMELGVIGGVCRTGEPIDPFQLGRNKITKRDVIALLKRCLDQITPLPVRNQAPGTVDCK
jgi:hypothetical protein